MTPPHPGEDCWRIERAEKASVIIDADAYFRHARAAMMKAKHRIMLIGWDFDAAISLIREDEAQDDAPVVIGEFITWLVERTPELEIFLLRWDVGAMKSMVRPTNLFTTLKWMAHPRVTVKLDSHHPPAASHHQKIVVIDDCFAFCGGIDMTGDRWDTRHHRDEDPGRHHPDGSPYGPWHDATTALKGPVAAALGDHARMRWAGAGGDPLEPIGGVLDCWPDALPVMFENVDVAIARTAPKMDDQEELTEIEALYLKQIAAAKRHIYAESQYFASRRIAEAIAARIAEPDGPDIVIVNPEQADGWLEQQAMDTARARLF
ncbi:MAG: phospholipase, partial [Sphingobium sp.]